MMQRFLQKRANCAGRSMIEMLGVLALVGILSIGGVWGYRKAVTKHLANSVIDDIYLSGFLIMDELFNRLPDDDVGMDMTGKFDQKSPYTFKAFAETSSTFEILVQNVPYDVCQEVSEREIKDIDEVRANGFDKKCFSDRTNEVSFFFDMNQSDRCSQDSDCGHCSECVNHRCHYGFKNRSGSCVSCASPTRAIYDVDPAECHRCKNRMYSSYNGGWSSYSGRCVVSLNHENPYWSLVPKEECEKFPKHYSLANGGVCYYCEGAYNRTTGVCSTADCVFYNWGGVILGVDEATCTQQCGGTYYVASDTADGKDIRCQLP